MSIEGVLENALSRILQYTPKLQASSRTDAGVHAKEQVVNFFLSKEIPLHKIQFALNCLLPKSIRITSISIGSPSFHPTLDCIKKEYTYHVITTQTLLPLERHHCWHFPHSLDIEKMRLAAQHFIGKKDFSAFANAGAHEEKIREVESIIITGEDHIQFTIIGKSFLYKMVRNIVGTLVYVGCEKIELKDIESILASKMRENAGVSAPASGLILNRLYF